MWRVLKRSKLLPKMLQWLLESVPDSAYIAGTKFSCALIEDDCELHLVARLELQTILHFFYMEEQFLAFTNFICDETKLQCGKKFPINTLHFCSAWWELHNTSKQLLPDLWHTRPRLCVEAPRYMPSSAQFELLCKPGTSLVLLSEDNRPCSPYS